MTRPIQKITKEYPPRGPLQQFRVESASAFHCFRCGCTKTSKLMCVYSGNWDRLLCNGCYGRLLSIYEVKAGTLPDEDRVQTLASILLSLATEEDAAEQERRLKIAESRSEHLAPQSLRFLATSAYVAGTLESADGLDWSAAVIGICKAFESEIVVRLMVPLREASRGTDLASDLADRDLSRIAKFCGVAAGSPPELGTVRYFLSVAAGSKQRIESSPLLRTLKGVFARWPRSGWLVDRTGGLEGIEKLTTCFRNRAAHIDALTKQDFEQCYALAAGPKGLLWELVLATSA